MVILVRSRGSLTVLINRRWEAPPPELALATDVFVGN